MMADIDRLFRKMFDSGVVNAEITAEEYIFEDDVRLVHYEFNKTGPREYQWGREGDVPTTCVVSEAADAINGKSPDEWALAIATRIADEMVDLDDDEVYLLAEVLAASPCLEMLVGTYLIEDDYFTDLDEEQDD
jgi:hypothetical protein